jgi:hypothetical protein
MRVPGSGQLLIAVVGDERVDLRHVAEEVPGHGRRDRLRTLGPRRPLSAGQLIGSGSGCRFDAWTGTGRIAIDSPAATAQSAAAAKKAPS